MWSERAPGLHSWMSFNASFFGNGNGDRIFVDIHTNKFYRIHDLPPWLWLYVKGINNLK